MSDLKLIIESLKRAQWCSASIEFDSDVALKRLKARVDAMSEEFSGGRISVDGVKAFGLMSTDKRGTIMDGFGIEQEGDIIRAMRYTNGIRHAVDVTQFVRSVGIRAGLEAAIEAVESEIDCVEMQLKDEQFVKQLTAAKQSLFNAIQLIRDEIAMLG